VEGRKGKKKTTTSNNRQKHNRWGPVSNRDPLKLESYALTTTVVYEASRAKVGLTKLGVCNPTFARPPIPYGNIAHTNNTQKREVNAYAGALSRLGSCAG